MEDLEAPKGAREVGSAREAHGGEMSAKLADRGAGEKRKLRAQTETHIKAAKFLKFCHGCFGGQVRLEHYHTGLGRPEIHEQLMRRVKAHDKPRLRYFFIFLRRRNS